MTDYSSGLRFDVYERITISDDMAGIEQFDEIELVPHIQLTNDDEQAMLRGHLLLSGKYTGADMRGQHEVSHTIPVEISLPMERIADLEHIGVEIENFDVDLLSERKLNVTGVLSLRGVVASDSAFVSDNVASEMTEFEGQAQLSEIQAVEQNELLVEDVVIEDEIVENEEIQDELTEMKVIEDTEELQEKIKIAFSSRITEEATIDPVPSHLDSLLHTQSVDLEQVTERSLNMDDEEVDKPSQQVELERSEAESEEQRETGEQLDFNVEWKSLLINREAPEKQFSKLKCCIVQKQESLDTIAERYGLNPRELILYNRLEDHDIAEGQVIYIPG